MGVCGSRITEQSEQTQKVEKEALIKEEETIKPFELSEAESNFIQGLLTRSNAPESKAEHKKVLYEYLLEGAKSKTDCSERRKKKVKLDEGYHKKRADHLVESAFDNAFRSATFNKYGPDSKFGPPGKLDQRGATKALYEYLRQAELSTDKHQGHGLPRSFDDQLMRYATEQVADAFSQWFEGFGPNEKRYINEDDFREHCDDFTQMIRGKRLNRIPPTMHEVPSYSSFSTFCHEVPSLRRVDTTRTAMSFSAQTRRWVRDEADGLILRHDTPSWIQRHPGDLKHRNDQPVPTAFHLRKRNGQPPSNIRRLACGGPEHPPLAGDNTIVTAGVGCCIFGLLLLLVVFVARRVRPTRKQVSLLPIWEPEKSGLDTVRETYGVVL